MLPLLLLLLTFALSQVVWRGLIDAHKAVNLLKCSGSQDRQAALRPRFLWGAAPKAPDCGRGFFPQKPSQTAFISKPPDFFWLSTAAWVFGFRQKGL